MLVPANLTPRPILTGRMGLYDRDSVPLHSSLLRKGRTGLNIQFLGSWGGLSKEPFTYHTWSWTSGWLTAILSSSYKAALPASHPFYQVAGELVGRHFWWLLSRRPTELWGCEENAEEGCFLMCPCLAQLNLPPSSTSLPARPTPFHRWGHVKQGPFCVTSGSRPGAGEKTGLSLTPVLGSTYVAIFFFKKPYS